MGKKRIIKTDAEKTEGEASAPAPIRVPKKKILVGMLHIEATFNNTKVLFSDTTGNVLFWSSAGSLGFRGAKKGTPFAAAKVGEVIGEKAAALGIKEAIVVVKGVGSGRESVIRSFMGYGIEITAIRDETPVPHNGPKAKKPRRV